MTEIPSLLRLASDAAKHAAARQTVIATNVANADTPGYRARDMAPFQPASTEMPLNRTHPGHLAGTSRSARVFQESGTPADPNGNTVSLQDQVLLGVEATRAHNRAVTIYKSSLDMLRASIGRN
ncbi:FlgB family protein [Jannaschia sp. 2305UL9-9]|uniref:FlgB family protein n=1 Tax=Jannaschia sp. 2305UL9-9 TaxID=3121638 RepID=UPI003528651C